MAIFNSYVSLPEGKKRWRTKQPKNWHRIRKMWSLDLIKTWCSSEVFVIWEDHINSPRWVIWPTNMDLIQARERVLANSQQRIWEDLTSENGYLYTYVLYVYIYMYIYIYICVYIYIYIYIHMMIIHVCVCVYNDAINIKNYIYVCIVRYRIHISKDWRSSPAKILQATQVTCVQEMGLFLK